MNQLRFLRFGYVQLFRQFLVVLDRSALLYNMEVFYVALTALVCFWYLSDWNGAEILFQQICKRIQAILRFAQI